MTFLLLTAALFNAAAIILPKKISPIEIYATVFFTIVLQLIVDTYLDLKYDLYGYFTKGVDFKTLIVIFGVYPAVNVIIVNFLPVIRKVFSIIVYIACLSILSLLYEAALIKVGVFYHNSWQLWYSAIIYPLLLIILILNWKLILYLFSKSSKKGS